MVQSRFPRDVSLWFGHHEKSRARGKRKEERRKKRKEEELSGLPLMANSFLKDTIKERLHIL